MNMRNFTLLFLLIILLFFYNKDNKLRKAEAEKQIQKAKLFSIEFDELKTINLEFLGENYRFEKKSDIWIIIDPVETRADGDIVKDVFKTMIDTKIIRTIDTIEEKKGEMDEVWEEKMSEYGLDIVSITIDFETFDQKQETLFLGKPTPALASMYGLKDGKVLMFDRAAREKILKNHSLFYWRNKLLTGMKKEDVLQYKIQLSDKAFLMERFGENDFMMLEPAVLKADRSVANGLLDYLYGLRASAVYDAQPANLPTEEPPLVVFTIFGKGRQEVVKFYQVAGRYGFAHADDTFYKIAPEVSFGFDVSILNLRNKDVVKFKVDNIDKLDIAFEGNNYSLEKKVDKPFGKSKKEYWFMGGKKIIKRNTPLIKHFLTELAILQAIEFPEKSDVNMDDVLARIVLKKDGVSVDSLTLAKKDADELFALNQAGGFFIVSKKIIDYLPGKEKLVLKLGN